VFEYLALVLLVELERREEVVLVVDGFGELLLVL
jgi:hypothetical protein